MRTEVRAPRLSPNDAAQRNALNTGLIKRVPLGRVQSAAMTNGGYPQELNSLPLLAGLDAADRHAMIQAGLPRRANKGELIFLAGHPCEGLWAVLDGRIKLVRSSPDGKELVLHLVEGGETFAAVGLFGQRTYPATAIALEETSLWLWPRDNIVHLLTATPELSVALLGALSAWTRTLVTKMELLTHRKVEERLALFLLGLGGDRPVEPGTEIPLTIPMHVIAGILGTAPEVLSRTLRKLEEGGIIKIGRRKITLTDPPGLLRIAGSTEPTWP